MGCWGEKRQRAAALQINSLVRLDWRCLWSAVVLRRFWGIAETTDLQMSPNSEMRPTKIRIRRKRRENESATM